MNTNIKLTFTRKLIVQRERKKDRDYVSHFVNIPMEIAEALNLQQGDRMIIFLDIVDGKIIVERKEREK